ncbi:MAG: hypothetical protein IJ232_11260 [Lachnospiraceae bacterium]|nr:hypothetical protein [Lachnospiraceae bacterium]
MNEDKENIFATFFKKGSFDKDKKEKILIGFLLGVFFLLVAAPVSDFTGKTGSKKINDKAGDNSEQIVMSKADAKNISNDEYISYLENKLEQMIGGMDGAGRVMVMITLKDGGEKILDKNRPYESATDTSKEDGREEVSEKIKSMQETVLVEQDGNTGPIVVKESYPDREGVVVLCEGGDNKELALKIKEAVSALFSLDAHKIVTGKLKS